jgi:hypothetical protein
VRHPADDDRETGELGMDRLLDRGEEGVDVDVEDPPGPRREELVAMMRMPSARRLVRRGFSCRNSARLA